MNPNEKLFYTLHSLARKNNIADRVIFFCARHVIFIVALFIAVLLWYERPQDVLLLYAQLAAALVVALLVSYAVGYFFKEQRPCERRGVTALFVPLNHWKSFPSDHTLIIFVLSGTLALAGMPLAALSCMAAGVLVGISRVIAGVHYPADILGGALLGWFVAVVVGMIEQWLTR